MKTKINFTGWAALFFLQVCLITATTQAQSEKLVTFFGKYQMADSVSNNQDAVLILNKDSTYINYGIFTNRATGDFYIWYSKGKFSLNGNSLACTYNEKMISDPALIQLIKDNYIFRKDHALIANYFEFVRKEYSAYEFTIGADNSISDTEKKFSYKK